MPTEIITTDDLREFKMELLDEIKNLLTDHGSGKIKQYLRSSEVQDKLQLSTGTLQNLRVNGTLPYSKIGSLIYYDADDIEQLMSNHRIESK